MKLYLLKQDVVHGYDTYDSAVVAARSEMTARWVHPSKYEEDWNGVEEYTWCAKEDVKVTYLGEATKGIKAGIIVSSFNSAG